MNVLSLFDGISCGRLALDRDSIKYNKYYASEVDKYAVAIAKYNYPDTIFIGDIRYIEPSELPQIDLLIGGSPCQDLSIAGKQKGMITKENIEITNLKQYIKLKKQGFEFEGQSYLFWEYVRLLYELKPKWFLLENVKMKKEWRDIITNTLKVKPIEINSALVSAQNRVRLYWTNIPLKGLPEDRKILLKDILESDVDEKYYIKKPFKCFLNNSSIIDKSLKCKPIAKLDIKGRECVKRIYSIMGKSPTLTTMQGGYRQPKILVDKRDGVVLTNNVNKIITYRQDVEVRIRKYYINKKELQEFLRHYKNKSNKTIKEISKYCNVPQTTAEHWFRKGKSFSIPSPNVWFKLKDILSIKTNRWDKAISEFEVKNSLYDMAKRIYDIRGKSPTLTTIHNNYKILIANKNNNIKIRKLTPVECERLQTLPDNYTKYGLFNGEVKQISDTQRYKTIGNGWTVDVIAWIFSFLPLDKR